MSSALASRIARRRSASSSYALPDVILRDEPTGELEEPALVIANVEARTRMPRRCSVINGGSRARANELHQEADKLFYNGDYESALVLYHRAARLCPRDLVHSVAAHRAEETISAAADPTRELSQLLRQARTPGQMSAVLCPEAAARRAKAIVAQSEDPVRDIPKILKYFDARKDFWRLDSPTTTPRRTRSKLMVKQLNKCVKSTVKDLESAYESGDAEALRKLSDELVNLVSLTEEPERNRVDAYAYLAEKQMAAGRHDRAIDLASRMFFLAWTAGDVVAIVEALVTLGKVHLKFGHLDALVHVWERLAREIEMEPIPKAWLNHDIGRCYLELGDFARALDFARICIAAAESAHSRKWILRGRLLSGQSFLKLGQFAEGVAALKIAAQLADEDENPILHYVQSLIDGVACYLRRLNEIRKSRRSVELTTRQEPTQELIGEAEFHSDRKEEDQQEKEEPGKREENEDFYGFFKNLEEKRMQTRQLKSSKDTSDEDEIARLLERTRALRRVQPGDKSAKVTSTAALSEEENDEDLTPDSSRTHIILRAGSEARDSEDERTLRLDELHPLSDLSCVEISGGDDFASPRFEDEETSDGEKEAVARGLGVDTRRTVAEEANDNDNEKPVSYFSPVDQLTSRSFSFSPDSGTEPVKADSQQELTRSISEYLRSLKSRDFEELEQDPSLFEARSANE